MPLWRQRAVLAHMKISASRFLSIVAASMSLLTPFGALGESAVQEAPQVLEYKEVVPLSSGQVRDGNVCVNFGPVMTAGDFFDGLQRHETPSGDEFRKNSRVVTNFPEQLTVQVQLSISVCDADIYTPAPAPGFVNGIRFKAQWKRGLAMRPVEQFAIQRVAIPSEEGDSRMLFLLKIRDKNVPLTDHLIISVISPQGKLLSRMSGRLESCISEILSAAAYGDPFEEPFDAGPLPPHQAEEFSRVESRGFFAEERFHAPLNVRRSPGAQTIAAGDNPVIAQGVQHGRQAGRRTRRPLAAIEPFPKVPFRRNGRIETFAERLLR